MIASLGEPFSSYAEVFAGFAVSAELVIPFFLAFGFSHDGSDGRCIHLLSRRMRTLWLGNNHFTVVLSDTDPSGIGSLC